MLALIDSIQGIIETVLLKKKVGRNDLKLSSAMCEYCRVSNPA